MEKFNSAVVRRVYETATTYPHEFGGSAGRHLTMDVPPPAVGGLSMSCPPAPTTRQPPDTSPAGSTRPDLSRANTPGLPYERHGRWAPWLGHAGLGVRTRWCWWAISSLSLACLVLALVRDAWFALAMALLIAGVRRVARWRR